MPDGCIILLGRGECVTLPRLLHLIQRTKGSDAGMQIHWCHFQLFLQLLQILRGKIIVRSYPTFPMHFPYSIRGLDIISKFTQLFQIYTNPHTNLSTHFSHWKSSSAQRESFILSNNDSFILCGCCGFHIMTWFVIRETVFHLEGKTGPHVWVTCVTNVCQWFRCDLPTTQLMSLIRRQPCKILNRADIRWGDYRSWWNAYNKGVRMMWGDLHSCCSTGRKHRG